MGPVLAGGVDVGVEVDAVPGQGRGRRRWRESSRLLPASASSAAVALTAVGPAPVTPMLALSQTPPVADRHGRGDAHHGVVGRLVTELGVGRARAVGQGGDHYLAKDLVRAQGRRQEIDEEVRGVDGAVLAGGAGHQLGAQGQDDGGQVRRRVGVGIGCRRWCRRCAPGRRRPVPAASARAGARWPHQVGGLDLGLGGHSADGEAAVLLADVGHALDLAQVDDDPRLGQPGAS